MGEKGVYFCEICELEFHDLDDFSDHCQQEHGAMSIEKVKDNIKKELEEGE